MQKLQLQTAHYQKADNKIGAWLLILSGKKPCPSIKATFPTQPTKQRDQIMQTRMKLKRDSGFVLPLVIAVGLIVTVGGFAMMTRSFGGLFGSIRSEHARQAREAAESGLAQTIEELNRKYNYLLINCYSETSGAFSSTTSPVANSCSKTGIWSAPSLPSAICKGSRTTGSYPSLSKTIDQPKSRYRINHFAFKGTSFYGGTGNLRITGERLNSEGDRILATAAIEQTFNIIPKPCPIGSGFPGLLGTQSIDLGGNDVTGITSGNVFCISCTVEDPSRDDGTYTRDELEDAVGANKNSDVDGQIYIGELHVPLAKTFPSELEAFVTRQSIDTELTITASDTATTAANANPSGMCATDSNIPPITHCLIDTIDLKRGFLTVDSEAGPVRLYVSGNVSAGGKSGIIHRQGSNDLPEPARLSLFGNPRDDSDSTHQTVMLSGVSKPAKAANLFVFVPEGTVGINGGAQGTAICDEETGECGGGDIHGAVWAKEWNGSNSNNAQLVVPANMGDQLFRHHGKDFAIGVSDFAGIGTNSYISQQGK